MSSSQVRLADIRGSPSVRTPSPRLLLQQDTLRWHVRPPSRRVACKGSCLGTHGAGGEDGFLLRSSQGWLSCTSKAWRQAGWWFHRRRRPSRCGVLRRRPGDLVVCRVPFPVQEEVTRQIPRRMIWWCRYVFALRKSTSKHTLLAQQGNRRGVLAPAACCTLRVLATREHEVARGGDFESACHRPMRQIPNTNKKTINKTPPGRGPL